MTNIKEVSTGIFLIDDNLYSIPGSGSVYLLVGDKKALIDTGPATSADVILEGIHQLGIGVEDVDYIIITHIHLDHGGGVGTLLKNMPQAKVLAHYKATKHLIDPSRLVASTIEAQGKESMDRNGEVLPVEESRLIPVHDGDILNLSDNQVLKLLECPGHAPHELCIFESRNQGIFAGDAVGHYIEGTDIMVPITPPPSFDLELYVKTLQRLEVLNAQKIYFAHFGGSDQVKALLEAAIRKLRERDALIAGLAAENKLEIAAEKLIKHICGELEFIKKEMRPLYDYWAGVDIPMSANEHVRYFRKKHNL
jgi:glyoxylase-like metal-dependent hydrolase (beta-lactamase superfamily II)